MPRTTLALTSFVGGEFSALLDGRTDFDKYSSGVKKLENFLVRPQGAATRRVGTQFIAEVKDSSKKTRLKVECIINHNNEITTESWSKTGHMSRKCYLVDNGPGVESSTPTSGLKPELDNFEFTMEQSEEGYKNFTVIQCKIKTIEWLYLAAKGHRRARFDIESKDTWLVP